MMRLARGISMSWRVRAAAARFWQAWLLALAQLVAGDENVDEGLSYQGRRDLAAHLSADR